ncbi:galactocerebrosidase-like [Haliotis rubra]|uniref:galactocerebrosidase-like n=1 Tax=Haliotis rubra TaxID=36100 RepID=UPI001EE5A355|nr:galactocerebrosidase-like [Haliotis rubra]
MFKFRFTVDMLLTSVLSLILWKSGSSFEMYTFDDTPGLGRVFDGIGAISGGGATSKLLVGYPEQQRNEILDYLFKPNFGASFHILKVEIGSDTQSTDGTESTHMRTPDEENYDRGYEWWLMLEAKKRNPDIKIYGLPWGFPGWVGGSTGNIYVDPDRTAMYVVKWVMGAKVHHNITVDYVGIWNERLYNTTYIKSLRKNLDANGLQNTKVIAADDGSNISWSTLTADILADPQLAAAVYGIGVHHPGTFSTPSAIATGKPLWASEDYSTPNNQTGAGCWARTLNQNYVNGNVTGCIAWALTTSWYYALPYFDHGLMNAFEPWSGNYEVSSPIWVTAHTTQFTRIGWRYLKHGSGAGKLSRGGSYVALVSPDGKDFTIIIETMSHDGSVCWNPKSIPWYDVSPQNITLVFDGSLAGITHFNPFFTQLHAPGEPTIFKQLPPIVVLNNRLDVYLGVNQLLTLTTLGHGRKGQYPTPPPSKPFPLPYTQDFESYRIDEEPYLFAQQIGSFEVHQAGGSHGQVMRQMTLRMTIPFCNQTAAGIAIIGNTNWTHIYVEADVYDDGTDASKGVFIAARVSKRGCKTNSSQGVFFFFYPQDNTYQLAPTLDRKSILQGGGVGGVTKGWNNISLNVEGTTAVGKVNNKTVFTYSDLPAEPDQGFVAVGTGSLGYADFDNVKITRPSGT